MIPMGLAMLGSSALSAGLNAWGAERQRRDTKDALDRQFAFSERMSSTAYQRAVKDLKAAGLHQYLAFGKPASSPTGGTAVFPNVGAAASEGISKGAATALAAKRMEADIDNVNMDTGLKRETMYKTQVEGANAIRWSKILDEQLHNAKAAAAEAQAREEFYKTDAGQITRKIGLFLKELGFGNSAGDLLKHGVKSK